jgi:hypothetical protein
MTRAIRVGMVVAAVVVVVGSASSPRRHRVQPSVTIKESYEDTWAGLIETFAAKGWAIGHMNKESGLITTDWIELGDEAERYADCGRAPLGSRVTTQARFNVIVKQRERGSFVSVTSAFRQLRSSGDPSAVAEVACASRGSVELTIHNEVAARASTRPKQEATEPQGPDAKPPVLRGFYCARSPSDAKVSICAREQADCERGRGAIAAAAVDIDACALVESAWCFDAGSGRADERCGVTSDACTAQRDAATGSAAPSECAEMR